MSLRTEAILTLRRARDILTQRLAERVAESADEILEDAEGVRYVGGIDEIYEQIVTRLAHINAMLSHLPPEEGATTSYDTHPAAPCEPGLATASVLDTNDLAIGSRSELPALPAPQATHSAAPIASAALSTVGTQIFSGDLEAAGASLAELFAVDLTRGRRCAETFADHLARNPDVMVKAMALRQQMAAGNFNASLMLLYDCFGLQGLEAVAVLQTLLGRLSEH
jgi:hypothetical protein